jgi:hypothetical protein
MMFTSKEITWACKMFLLDELKSSKTLRESLSYDEKDKFKNFVKDLKVESILKILREDHQPSPFDYDIDSPLSLKELERGLKDALGIKYGIDKKIIVSIGLATLLAIIGYLLYRKYKDRCKQICSKSVAKAGCMNKCRVVNIRAIIRTLNNEKSKCGTDKKCIMKFEKKIRGWQEKLRSVK